MCLSVPARLLSVSGSASGPASEGDALSRTGKVSFGGVTKEISLAYVPDARVGDYVLVHVGFAISVIDEEEARFVFDYLEKTGQGSDVSP